MSTTQGRWITLGALVFVASVLVLMGGAPVVSNSLSVWFVEDDPARVAYENFQDLFGNDEVVVLAIGTPDMPLTRPVRDAVASTAAEMRGVSGVASVTSPADANAGPLADLLVNSDSSVFLLMARLEVMTDADARRHEILLGLRQAVASLARTGVELHWAGIGLVYDELNEVSFRETPLLTGASFVLVGVVLYAVAGSWIPVLLALASVVISTMVLMGVFSLAGFQLNMVTAILPTLMLVVGTATAVHIFTRLQRATGESPDGALQEVFKPCLFTALTTAAGFASLMTARMGVIRDLGAFAALGVLISLVVTFVFARAIISTRWSTVNRGRTPRSAALLEGLAGWVVSHPRPILTASAVVAGLSLFGATKVVVDTYSIEFFREGHSVRVDSEAIEAGYGWYLPLEFAVQSPDQGHALEPALLATISDWQSRVEESGEAQWSLSVADFASPGSQPATIDPVAAGLVDEARSTVRVTFGVPMASARGWAERIDHVLAMADETLPDGSTITEGGYLPLYVRMMDYVVDTQVRSFAVALVLVFAIMGVFLGSPRIMLLALLPNLLPILLIFGVMGSLGIRLDIATVTVAAIALGIVVDDTVHLLFHFRRNMEVTGDRATAVRAALVDVGPALLGTTAILTASFAVLGFASVLSIALFGLLSAATLVFALVADLLVLPAMLMVWGPSPRSFTISSSGGSHD
jgi:predicted RND superfamily exporter protein